MSVEAMHSKVKHHINGKHIRHSANNSIKPSVEVETTYLVKSSTPFISGVKKINKILDKFNKTINRTNRKYQGGEYKKVNYITVKGMGKAIPKTLSIACKFQDEMDFKVDILTGSTEVLDEFEPDESIEGSIEDTVYKKRKVSYIELRIWLKRE